MVMVKGGVLVRHRVLGHRVNVPSSIDWAYPIEGLKFRGMQFYRVIGEDGAYVESMNGGEFPAFLVDRGEIGELSWAKAHIVDEAMADFLATQVRE